LNSIVVVVIGPSAVRITEDKQGSHDALAVNIHSLSMAVKLLWIRVRYIQRPQSTLRRLSIAADARRVDACLLDVGGVRPRLLPATSTWAP